MLPSLAGLVVFLFPVFSEDQQTIVFGLITDWARELLSPWLFEALLVLMTVAALGSLGLKLSDRPFREGSIVAAAFDASWPWVALRLIGLAVGLSVYFQIGPSVVYADNTGIMVINDIGISQLMIFVIGIGLMPLLTDYGLLEFVGTLAREVFKRLFRLPGRAVVDTIASIVTASSVGLLVTLFQYERGFYNARQASIIACNFSIVSIPFCLLIADVANIQHVFFGWYVSVVGACLVCAAILARTRPLAGIEPSYLVAAALGEDEVPLNVRAAYRAALARAKQAEGFRGYVATASRNVVATTFGVIGPTMALATTAAVVIFHTPTFDWFAYPLAWLLQSLGVAQAQLIAPGFLVGFFDQFMPALIAANVEEDYWRFVLGGLSVTQLVFLSEFGMLVLRSKLPVDLKMLFIVFVQRTLITGPILMLAAWLVV